MSDAAGEFSLVPLGQCPMQAMRLDPDGKGVVIGRSPGASIRLDHPSISRQHASVTFQNGNWVVTDLGSRHGTLVNGVAITPRTPTPLKRGDRISLRPWTVRFEHGAHQASSTVVQTVDSGVGANTVMVVQPEAPKTDAERQLDLLIKASLAIQAAASESSLAQELTRACVDGTRCERALLVRYFTGENRVEVIGSHPDLAQDRRPVSRTLLRAANEGKTVRLSEDASYGAAMSIVGTGVNGALCVPIMIDTTPEAFLYLDHFSTLDKFDGVASFSQALARMTASAMGQMQRHDLEQRQRALMEELASARRVQERMMGSDEGDDGVISWRMASIPGQVVAGDIFGVKGVRKGESSVVFLGDVSGKGLGPGLLMAAITAYLDASVSGGRDLDRALRDLSNFVLARAVSGQFATFALAEFDRATRTLSLFDAGHGYYFLLGAEGSLKPMEVASGIPIGVLEDFEFERTRIRMSPGDRLVLFSDGVAEQTNDAGEMLGKDRAGAALAGSRSCAEDVERLASHLKAFAGSVKYVDDVTIASIAFAPDAQPT
jgi:serine phosphatase RsbU (regulator of sigma subunit)